MANSHNMLGSSMSLLSGDLAACVKVDYFMGDFGGAFYDKARSAAAEATQTLQRTASYDDQWSAYADAVSVEFSDGDFVFVLRGDDEDLQRMREIEHGGPEHAPSPLIRQQATAIIDSLTSQLLMRMDLS